MTPHGITGLERDKFTLSTTLKNIRFQKNKRGHYLQETFFTAVVLKG
jgi:hypothetical protein